MTSFRWIFRWTTTAGTCLALLAMAAVAFLAATASPAHASQAALKSLWGPIKFGPGVGGCPAGGPRCSAFPYYRDLGVEVFQYQLQWNQIAPTRPTNPRNPNDPAYRWSGEFDFAVREAAAAGIKLMFLIKGSPPWANGGREPRWAPDPRAYADFAYAAAKRFPDVHLWEVWGESNRHYNFMPQGRKGARTYARILDAAYGALKSVSRRNLVVGGMTLSGGEITRVPFWIRNLIGRRGHPPRMDLFGHNPYQGDYPHLRRKPRGTFRGFDEVRTLWREVKRHYQRRIRRGRRKGKWVWIRNRGRPRRLWLSEWMIQSDHASWAMRPYVSQDRQARWLRAGFRLTRRLWFVRGLGWYQLSDHEPTAQALADPDWGLITETGYKKPAYFAFRALP